LNRPSKRFLPSRLQDRLVPVLLVVLGLALVGVIVLVILVSFGVLGG
jgi:hypothetical protein